MQNLFDLKKGQKCLVEKIITCGSMQRRFLDIGLTPNTLVECVNISPNGDPKAFLIRGAVIAIRKEDCKKILIKEVLP